MNVSSLHRLALAGAIVAGSLAFAPARPFAADAPRPLPPGYGERTDYAMAGARHVDLVVGKSMILDLPRDATEIFVANPDVANAVVRSARRLYIIGSQVGQTTITAMDATGQRIATIDLSIGRDMDQLRRLLAAAIPDNEIVVSTVGDTVVLTGSVADALQAQKAADIATAFVGYSVVGSGGATTGGGGGTSISIGGSQVVNGKLVNALTIRAKDQVTLRVTIAEVQRKVLRQLGINATATHGTNSFSLYEPSLMARDNMVTSGLARLATAGGISSLSASIQAMEKNGFAHVLAEPTVTAISGEPAKFNAGGTIPIYDSSTVDPATGRCTITTKLQPYGVSLNFIPTVLSAGRISLQLSTTVTEVDDTNSFSFSCGSAVGFRTRTNDTTVELPSGGSIVSAGLIQQSSSSVLKGLPGLMDLPILGSLFRSRDYQRAETELLIIVTPFIAKTLRPDQVTRPDDGFVDATDAQAVFLGRVNRAYSTNGDPRSAPAYRGRVGFIHD